MNCVVRTIRREDLAVWGNVEQLQAPTSSVRSTRNPRPPDESPSKTHAHTPNALKSRPKVRKSPEYPWTKPKTARTILYRQ